jgi:hypothetical protein
MAGWSGVVEACVRNADDGGLQNGMAGIGFWPRLMFIQFGSQISMSIQIESAAEGTGNDGHVEEEAV